MAKIDLRENEFFEKFVGPDHVDSNDTLFWYHLLSCSFNFTRVHDPKSVDRTLSPYIDLLALNNSQSHNLGSLVQVTMDRVSRIRSKGNTSADPYYTFQSFNAIYLTRTICKNFIENSSEEMLIQAFRAKVPSAQQPQQQQKSAPTPTPPQHMQQPNTMTTQLPEVQADQAKTPVPESDVKKEEIIPGQQMLDRFISTLIEIIVDIPSNDLTYLLEAEAINALLVLLSIQMYSNNRANQFYVYKTLMHKKCSIHALVLTKTLLNNFINQDPMPRENGSIILGLASGLWKVLTLGYGQDEDECEEIPHLARASLLLLNVLTNHHTTGQNPYREAIIHCQDSRFNPSDPKSAFDIASNDAVATASTSQSILTSNNIKVDFERLFQTICRHLHNDQVALLLYLLLHSNKIYRPYVLTSVAGRLDQLLLPLLKILYSNIQKGSHHIYMILIILVILSEESTFSNAINEINVRGITWYKDRMITEISLSSFSTLIIVRSFQHNTFRIKDKFLHTNLFAILGNLSNHVRHLHPYVCQRIVDLLERLTKRYLALTKPTSSVQDSATNRNPLGVFRPDDPLTKALATDTYKYEFTEDASALELDSSIPHKTMSTSLQNGGGIDDQGAINICIPEDQSRQHDSTATNPISVPSGQGPSISNGGHQVYQQSPSNCNHSDQINIAIDDAKMDLAWIEEIIRMLLEVINNLLDSQLANNADMIYTLLYKRKVFNSLMASHPSFYNMVINIERTLTYFYNKIESCQRQLTVEEIKEMIENSSKEWCLNLPPRDMNSKLLFRYVEDEQPEDFFIPYMWNKIYYSSGISWDPKRIVLFNPEIA